MFSIKFSTQSSVFIAKPIDEVFACVGDFRTWRQWSPWLCQEPNCPVEVGGQKLELGHKQAWDGQRIGTGEMVMTGIVADKSLTYDLFFIKPWKSQATAEFHFEQKEKGTLVTWTMLGTLPFFLFFFKKMMASMIRMDYQRGLSMLKELCERGEIHSETLLKGDIECEGFHYVGIAHSSSLDAIGEVMAADFEALGEKVKTQDLPEPDFALAFYSKFDIVAQKTNFISALGYRSPPRVKDQSMLIGSVPSHRAIGVDHLGDYRFLGNAWATAMTCQRSDRMRINKGVDMYEIYRNDPKQTASKDLLTEVYLPVK